MTGPPAPRDEPDRYKWIALANTTIGGLLAAMNSSILLIALPGILTGIGSARSRRPAPSASSGSCR